MLAIKTLVYKYKVKEWKRRMRKIRRQKNKITIFFKSLNKTTATSISILKLMKIYKGIGISKNYISKWNSNNMNKKEVETVKQK